VTTLDLARVADESALRRWHEIRRLSVDADFVALPADPIQDVRPALTGPYNGQHVELWVATASGDPVATLRLSAPIHDNLDLVNVEVDVHPEHRRRGYGRAAVDAALDLVRDRGRSRVLFEVPTRTRTADPAPGEALARAVGARPMLAERRRLLDLHTHTSERLTELEQSTLEAAAGYSIVTWVDHTPEPFIDDMAELNALMSTDPPQGDLDLEPQAWDAKRYLEREASIIERGRRHLTAAARETATGRLVGFTDFGVPAGDGKVGYQWDTIVRGEHRGHRLGLRLKVANLRELLTQLPQVRYLNTWNANDNRHMIAVNEQLGFTPMEGWTEWGVTL
jgi:GNAT superfamily N-acetyltransferase